MIYLIKILIFVILTFTSVANASNNSFVGVIGAAIGDIKNQKTRASQMAQKYFLEILLYRKVNQMHKYYFLIKLY